MAKQEPGFIDLLKEIPDHRIDRKKLYPVEELMLLTICGLSAGADGWDDLELFGKLKLNDLRKYFPFENGTPSDDTLRRFFRTLDPLKFEEFFTLPNWVLLSRRSYDHEKDINSSIHDHIGFVII